MMTDTDQTIGETKVCTKCRIEKPLNEFYLDKRWGTPRSRCRDCTNVDAVEYVKANPQKSRAAAKRRRDEGRSTDKERMAMYYQRNKDEIKKRSREYREENRDTYLETARNSMRKKRSTVMGKLTDAISRALKRGLISGVKAGRRAFDILPYTPDELRAHLERQFLPGMSWDNYGLYGWHIDHIVPLSSFSYESVDDEAFKSAWSLTNLRPLWREDNLKKGGKVITFV